MQSRRQDKGVVVIEPASYEYLKIEIDDGIASILINRPETLNACRMGDHAEMGRMLRELQWDDRVRVAVITGAGKAFSVGGDFSITQDVLSEDRSLKLEIYEHARQIVYGHLDLEKPIIAAINGKALGGGAALALLCDITVADRGARISDGHIIGGIAAGDGGLLTWPLNAGMAKAKRFLLTGDWITAEEAERIGLITEVVDDGECLDVALGYARRLAAGPQKAIRYTKRAMNMQLRRAAIESFELSLALEMLSSDSGDHERIVRGWMDGTKMPEHHGLDG